MSEARKRLLVTSGFVLFGLILLALLGGIQLLRERPSIRSQLEQQISDWLAANSAPDATVAGLSRAAELAGRTFIPLADEMDLIGSLAMLEAPPDYVVVSRHIAADQLTRTGWFQERYEALHQVTSPYDSASPYTIWGYRPTIYELGTAVPLNVKAADAIEIVGYEFAPQRAAPGQLVQLTLFLRSLKSLTDSVQLTMRLEAADGQVVAETAVQFAPPIQSGQVVTETVAITTRPDLPLGAYEINFSLGLPDQSVWPLYRNNDINQLDRVRLGHVIVPWQGDLNAATPIAAVFGDQIELTAFAAAQNDGGISVRLYWQALRSPEQDYVVFVHALDTAGNLVAGHDGAPVDGRFPTTTWLIGDIVEDVHTLSLESAPESGDLRLQVGLYLPATGERLPVWDSAGVEQPARAMPLTTLSIR